MIAGLEIVCEWAINHSEKNHYSVIFYFLWLYILILSRANLPLLFSIFKDSWVTWLKIFSFASWLACLDPFASIPNKSCCYSCWDQILSTTVYQVLHDVASGQSSASSSATVACIFFCLPNFSPLAVVQACPKPPFAVFSSSLFSKFERPPPETHPQLFGWDVSPALGLWGMAGPEPSQGTVDSVPDHGVESYPLHTLQPPFSIKPQT